MASSAIVNIVEVGLFGPVGTPASDIHIFHFATVFWLMP